MKTLLTLILLLFTLSIFSQTPEEKKAARMEQLADIRVKEVARIAEVNSEKAQLKRSRKTKADLLKERNAAFFDRHKKFREAFKRKKKNRNGK